MEEINKTDLKKRIKYYNNKENILLISERNIFKNFFIIFIIFFIFILLTSIIPMIYNYFLNGISISFSKIENLIIGLILFSLVFSLLLFLIKKPSIYIFKNVIFILKKNLIISIDEIKEVKVYSREEMGNSSNPSLIKFFIEFKLENNNQEFMEISELEAIASIDIFQENFPNINLINSIDKPKESFYISFLNNFNKIIIKLIPFKLKNKNYENNNSDYYKILKDKYKKNGVWRV